VVLKNSLVFYPLLLLYTILEKMQPQK